MHSLSSNVLPKRHSFSFNKANNINRAIGRFMLLFSFVTALLFLSTPSFAQNAIVTENALAGSPASEWDIVEAGDTTIQGFATDMSVNNGETVRFKIKTNAASYSINIYRIGYYQGNGARKVGTGTVTATLPQIQPAPLTEAASGLIDCGNWGESANWLVPSSAVSGIYIAKLTRADTKGSSHIIFIVRDDASTSDLYFKTSDATWQAYNQYNGNSLYGGNTTLPEGHAAKVSYNRPIITRGGSYGTDKYADFFFNAEYPMVRWLERNGYSVSYTTCVDVARSGNLIKNHKAFLSVGHDEYWSANERDYVDAARNAGVNLAFFSGNEMYWKTRWEPSIDASKKTFRTLVCYKEGTQGERACGGKCDPLPNVWTGLWKSGCQNPTADGCRPENSLTGQRSWYVAYPAIALKVPSSYKKLRFWRNTSVAGLADGSVETLTNGTLGFEIDYEQPDQFNPPGRFTLTETLVTAGVVHKMSLYKHSSGALVFGAGTIQWSWGLDEKHDGYATSVQDVRIQQATVNLFADMKIQPATLQTNLIAATASTDVTPPVSSIVSPTLNATLKVGVPVTINGTATDVGGVVAGVEVSVDGGLTWSPAAGSENWSFIWTPTALGNVNILTRSVDDNGNIEAVKSTAGQANRVVNVDGKICPCTVFQTTDVPALPVFSNATPLEVGFKFKAVSSGKVTGIRFFKGEGTTGSHVGHLWDKAGNSLAVVTFSSETNSGWQQVLFSAPVNIVANTTYVASIFSSSGDFAVTNPYFTKQVVNGPLVGLATGDDGPNGVYKYTSTPAFPTENFESSNYWVDVVYENTITSTLPVVTLQPITQTLCAGSVVNLTASAQANPNPAVQWQVSADGTSWTNLPGATSAFLSFSAAPTDNGKSYRAAFTNAAGTVYTNAAKLTISSFTVTLASKTDAVCTGTGGSITVTVAGTATGLQYTLDGTTFQSSNVFTNLAGGVYNVTVKDSKGCTGTLSNITINQTSSISGLVISKTDVSCNGNDGFVSVFGSNGTAPYTYSINDTAYQTSGSFSGLSAKAYNVFIKDAKGCKLILPNIVIGRLPALTATSVIANAGCKGNDGSITVSATGGTSPYQYSVNGGNFQTSNVLGNLRSGNYSVIVKDAKNCTFALPALTLAQAQGISVSLAGKTDAACGSTNGTITVNASGGRAPYFYILNNGVFQVNDNSFSNLAPGVYTVWVIDINNCYSYVDNVTIGETSTLGISVKTVTNETCVDNNGSVVLSATGGSGSYQYKISGGSYQSSSSFNNLSAGTFSFIVKDSKGCTDTVNNVKVNFIPFVLTASKINAASCLNNDGSIELTLTGGIPSYQFSVNGSSYFSDADNIISRLDADTYSINARDSKGCIAKITGVVMPVVKLTATASKTNACSNINNGTINMTPTGGTAPYQYSLNGGSYRSSNIFTSLSPATYSVTVKDSKGCTVTVTGISITRLSTSCSGRGVNATGVSDTTIVKVKKEAKKSFIIPKVSIYPNPSNGDFTVMLNGFSGNNVKLRLLDAVGRESFNRQVSIISDNFLVPFKSARLSKGLYYLNISAGSTVYNEKIVIQ